MKKTFIIIFVIALAVLIGSLYAAEKGILLPLILLFPSYLLTVANTTVAGLVASVQFPLYYYASTFGNTKKKKLLIVLITILAHLLMVNAVIKN